MRHWGLRAAPPWCTPLSGHASDDSRIRLDRRTITQGDHGRNRDTFTCFQTSPSMPESTLRAWPVTWRPASEHRNRIWLAMSPAVTKAFRWVVAVIWSRMAFSEMPAASALARITRSMRAPSTGPGWMQLTRMPWRPRSIAQVRVKPEIHNLAAGEVLSYGRANLPTARARG